MIPMPVQRMGDVNTGGGAILMGIPNVLVNGLPIAVMGMPVSPHSYYHVGTVTVPTQFSVICNGMPVIKMGDVDSCGDMRLGGSLNVFVG